MMSEITWPERVLYYLQPGRLEWIEKFMLLSYLIFALFLHIVVSDCLSSGLPEMAGVTTLGGWGVVVNVVKKPPASLGSLPSTLSSRGGAYIVDTLLHCSPGSGENGSRPKPYPPCPGEKGEMHVVNDSGFQQLKAAAHAVGEVDLENKFAAASASLRRGVMFANSFYL
ncbi:hypothetical protein Ancab_002481 [Ancistrocladus abbreviatus]